MKQSPIFGKTYDFVAWIIPMTIKFPRQQRFVMAAALQREALRFQELLIEAVHQKQPAVTLRAADAELDKVRTHLRMSLDLGLIQIGQYEHALFRALGHGQRSMGARRAQEILYGRVRFLDGDPQCAQRAGDARSTIGAAGPGRQR